MLQVISLIHDARQALKPYKQRQLAVGLVPTMGALHEGHLSLVRQARKENGVVVVSIFVNPLQFGKNEDFGQYPRTFDNDCKLLSREGVDVVFSPTARELYPDGFCVAVVPERLEDKLCGKSRPGHFRGVAVVVTKLFNIINPDVAYFGQKDFQQSVIIKRLVADLNMNVTVKALPTVRSKEGLALSSRNAYLGEAEKKDALCLYHALMKAQSLVNAGTIRSEEIIREMETVVAGAKPVSVDYISIVTPDTLEPVAEVRRGDVAALAVRIGKTRLIDNIILILMVAILIV